MNYEYSPQVEKLLSVLADGTSPLERAKYLMFDLYANGLRRLKNAQYEDAGVRAYRMAEMLGQIYLMKEGYQSDRMPASDKKVSSFAEAKGMRSEGGTYRFNRTQVIDFLDQQLNYNPNDIRFLRDIEKDVRDLRNKSILIHGYTAKVVSSERLERIFSRRLFPKMKELIQESEFNEILQSAMFLNNNFKAENNE